MLYVSSLPQVRDFAQQEAFRIDSSSLIPFIEKELLHIDLLNSFVPQMQNTSENHRGRAEICHRGFPGHGNIHHR